MNDYKKIVYNVLIHKLRLIVHKNIHNTQIQSPSCPTGVDEIFSGPTSHALKEEILQHASKTARALGAATP